MKTTCYVCHSNKDIRSWGIYEVRLCDRCAVAANACRMYPRMWCNDNDIAGFVDTLVEEFMESGKQSFSIWLRNLVASNASLHIGRATELDILRVTEERAADQFLDYVSHWDERHYWLYKVRQFMDVLVLVSNKLMNK